MASSAAEISPPAEDSETATVSLRWRSRDAIAAAFIDSSVVSVALPAMQSDLAASVREAQWIVNSYMLLLGALILIGGAAGDRFGRRRTFLIGLVAFTAASVACGLAPSSVALIAARALQGVGAAMLVPSSLAIISAAFPEKERGRAIGTWAGASALTTALGPVLGGWLTDAWSWRAIFFINVPVAAVAVAIALWHMPESHDRTADRVDWAAAIDAWVESGKAPDRIIARKVTNGATTRTRPLCAYPQRAVYKGSGSTDEAENFECRQP